MKIETRIKLSEDPRFTAFQVLEEVAKGALPEERLLKRSPLLNKKNQSLCAALVYEVLRHQSYLDYFLESMLVQKKPSDSLRIILRLGLAQLLFFNRLGEHAVLMETVNLAKKLAPGRHNVVNAILRGFLRKYSPAEQGLPKISHVNLEKRLALNYSFPKWLVSQWTKVLGAEDCELLLKASNQPVPPTIRVNQTKISREELKNFLPFETVETQLSPLGLKPLAFHGSPEHWPGYQEGYFAIQDEASQLLSLLISSVKKNARVLDACAGLGGKSLLLATQRPDLKLEALDKDLHKLAMLKKEAVRLGVNNFKIKNLSFFSYYDSDLYDVVILDAPCTGSGVIRRRPDLKWSKQADDQIRLAELQLNFLNKSAKLLKPGGRLIYSVCSLSEAEGPNVFKQFLAENKSFSPLDKKQWPESLQELLTDQSYLQLWPHKQPTDGFFWAQFMKL